MFLSAVQLPAATATPGEYVSGQGLREIVPPEPYHIAGSPLWLVLAIGCAVLAGLLLWYVFFRRVAPKPGPTLSARELAERRLSALAGRIETLDARAFGGEVTEVLRAYIGGQFGLHPERQTSPEFLASVSGSHVFTKTEHVLLADFLEGCDLLKFARADATLERKRHLLTQAEDFVRTSSPPPLPEADVAPPLPPPALSAAH